MSALRQLNWWHVLNRRFASFLLVWLEGRKSMEGCYPCSVYGHGCTMGVDRKKRAAVVCLPLHGWFDVALWVRWPGALFPAYVGEVKASSAFEAIERMMVAYRVRSVAYAAAIACDGSLIYRVHRVRL